MTDLTEDAKDWAFSFDEERFSGGYSCREEAAECGIVEGADPWPGEDVTVYTGWLDTDAEPLMREGEELYPIRDVEAHDYTFEQVVEVQGG